MDVLDILTKRRTMADALASGYGLQKIGDGRVCYLSKDVGLIEEKQIDRSKMAIEAVITTQDEDRSNDVILTDGIDISKHERNPVVMYGHGITFDKPIGKAQDDTGNYTVARESNRLRATTYFSQTLPEAYELFGLAAEGILRGWSIGAVPVETENRDVLNPFGMAALLVKRCEMFEYSLTPTPDNRMALTERILKSETGGAKMLPALLKCFQPWLLPVPKIVSVPEGVPVAKTITKETPTDDKTEKKPGDEGYQELDKKPDEAKKSDPPADEPKPEETKTTEPEPEAEEPDKYAEYPHGAVMLAQSHDRFMEMANYYATAGKKLDSAPVKEYVAATAEIIEERCEAIKELWKAEYSDFDEPSGEAEEDEGEEKKPVEKNLTPRLGRYLRAFRKSLTKGVSVSAAAIAENAVLKSDNAKLNEAVEKLLKTIDKLKADIRAAKRGR